MVAMVTKDAAQTQYYDADDQPTEDSEAVPASAVANYIGDVARLDRGPQAFLVEIFGEYTIEPHFHEVDQFQIMVRGDSVRLGKHDASPVTVHYVDSYTPYGPIVCAEDGISFFNLRARGDLGAHYMPAEHDNLHRRA